jgi:hypothetical protein
VHAEVHFSFSAAADMPSAGSTSSSTKRILSLAS